MTHVPGGLSSDIVGGQTSRQTPDLFDGEIGFDGAAPALCRSCLDEHL